MKKTKSAPCCKKKKWCNAMKKQKVLHHKNKKSAMLQNERAVQMQCKNTEVHMAHRKSSVMQCKIKKCEISKTRCPHCKKQERCETMKKQKHCIAKTKSMP